MSTYKPKSKAAKIWVEFYKLQKRIHDLHEEGKRNEALHLIPELNKLRDAATEANRLERPKTNKGYILPSLIIDTTEELDLF